MAIKPRFDECYDCRHFKKNSVSPRCLRCLSGEFFEEKIEEMDPDNDDYWSFRGSSSDE